jgi:hypothetical protein
VQANARATEPFLEYLSLSKENLITWLASGNSLWWKFKALVKTRQGRRKSILGLPQEALKEFQLGMVLDEQAHRGKIT